MPSPRVGAGTQDASSHLWDPNRPGANIWNKKKSDFLWNQFQLTSKWADTQASKTRLGPGLLEMSLQVLPMKWHCLKFNLHFTCQVCLTEKKDTFFYFPRSTIWSHGGWDRHTWHLCKEKRRKSQKAKNEVVMETIPERRDQDIKKERKQNVNLKAREPQDGGHSVGGW